MNDFGEFQFEVPGGTSGSEPVLHKASGEDIEALQAQMEALVPSSAHKALQLQLRLWWRARSLAGRREVAALSLLAICNAVKHIGAFESLSKPVSMLSGPYILQQFLQKRQDVHIYSASEITCQPDRR